jgi:hypothetical protein
MVPFLSLLSGLYPVLSFTELMFALGGKVPAPAPVNGSIAAA